MSEDDRTLSERLQSKGSMAWVEEVGQDSDSDDEAVGLLDFLKEQTIKNFEANIPSDTVLELPKHISYPIGAILTCFSIACYIYFFYSR
jgi:hypothetical protein